MNDRASILLINPFFGPWPSWMAAFLESCRSNADIQWLLLGDQPCDGEMPPNVRFQKMTLPELLERASAATGFNVQKDSYSQCDIRPAYGKIFAGEIKGYDFWGHFDLDVLWGRLREFFTDEILAENFIISSMKGRVAGHLTLYRNTSAVNNLFFRAPGCRIWLECPKYHSFDETLMTKHIRGLLREQNLPFRVFWDDTLVVHVHELRKRPHGWMWKSGRILDAVGQERMYLHFAEWKHIFRFIELGSPGVPLHITRFGISYKPFSYLHYWKWHVPELLSWSYWRQVWIVACRKFFCKYGII